MSEEYDKVFRTELTEKFEISDEEARIYIKEFKS